MKKLLLVPVIALTACGQTKGPSVPYQPGANLADARQVVRACAPLADQGGQDAVSASYVTGALLGGLLLGPAVVAAAQYDIREWGKADAVDECLEKRGWQRRNLTAQETVRLNSLPYYQRQYLLDHLISGGSLATFDPYNVR